MHRDETRLSPIQLSQLYREALRAARQFGVGLAARRVGHEHHLGPTGSRRKASLVGTLRRFPPERWVW